MQFTITEAAKLYGKQRKTLYRHLDAGRLSCGVRGDGKRVIDLSELIRCYGEPPGKIPVSDTHSTRDDSVSDTLVTQALIEELRKQTAVIERMSERIEQLEQALLRLPAPSEQAATEPAPNISPQATINPPRQPPKDFSDLLARFESRRHGDDA